MKILYFNNCWFTNVGEAFIDMGGMEIVRRIFPNSQIACISAMTDYYVRNVKTNKVGSIFHKPADAKRRKNINVGCISDYLEADYLILPGMMGTTEFLDSSERLIVDQLVLHGCKIIFLGLGGWEYNAGERDTFRRYLQKINPALVVTRDNTTYDSYKDYSNCIKGLDCAFWTKDVFDPRGFGNGTVYDVVTFNRSKEPDIFSGWKRPVIRPWHMQYSYDSSCYRKKIMLSDTPYDYLTVYANASRVYTDLVHASIIALMYGIPVKYWYVDKRSLAFHALDAIQISDKGWMKIKAKELDMQKQKIISRIISEIKEEK